MLTKIKGAPTWVASWTLRSSSLSWTDSAKTCASAAQQSQLEVASAEKRPPHNSWPADTSPERIRKRISQCCGSGMFIPDPYFYPFRLPDLGSKNSNKREGWKKIVVKPFFVAKNFTKLKIILFFKCVRKKFGPVLKKLELFTQKFVTKL